MIFITFDLRISIVSDITVFCCKEIKMEDLLSLNYSSAKKETKIKKFDSLENGEYTVKSFKLKDTNFGLRVFAEIDNFYLSLPPRFSDKINSEEQIAEINSKKWKMTYGGKDAAEFNKLIIDFKQMEKPKSQEAQIIESETADSEEMLTPRDSRVKRSVEERPKQYGNRKIRKLF